MRQTCLYNWGEEDEGEARLEEENWGSSVWIQSILRVDENLEQRGSDPSFRTENVGIQKKPF